MSIRRSAQLALSLAAFIAAGCGGAPEPADERQVDDRSAVQATMKSYLTALADGDGAKACSLLTAAARRQVVGQIKQLDPALKSKSCAQTLATLAESVGASTAAQACGAGGGAECRRIAMRTARDLIADLKDVEIEVQVSGDAATAGPAAGPQGYDGELRKIDGEWLISRFSSI